MRLADVNMERRRELPESRRPITQQLVLELLNDAVWAPNHRLREPWRFIFVEQGSMGGLPDRSATTSARLIVVMNEEADPFKQREDFAAVCCLIQNVRLLAWERGLAVERTMPEWIYDGELGRSFGVRDAERIVAVLELGDADTPQRAAETAPGRLRFDLL
ncbi:hypothetical protein ACFFNY_25410 [Paenibacillus hodogayensis]|uniref:Nitroreductase n=1 Tax=Paenibacillus hodogayensis TaxID=279208 RepID=A0ABV5W3H7_9BACL